MKKGLAVTIILIHNSLIAAVSASLFLAFGYVVYEIYLHFGWKVLEPHWGLRFLGTFLGLSVLYNGIFFWKDKQHKVQLTDYALTLKFEREFANQDVVSTLLKRQNFQVVEQSEGRTVASRRVGKLLRRSQRLEINKVGSRFLFEVSLLNSIYPIDILQNNFNAKISFLNN